MLLIDVSWWAMFVDGCGSGVHLGARRLTNWCSGCRTRAAFSRQLSTLFEHVSSFIYFFLVYNHHFDFSQPYSHYNSSSNDPRGWETILNELYLDSFPEIQQTRDSIFSSLVDYVSRELSDAEIIAFFILVSKYYSNSPDENKIAKNNMTLKEKESAESVCRNFTNGQFIIHVTSDCSAVLSGLVAFRCELLPELVICRPLTFRDVLHPW